MPQMYLDLPPLEELQRVFVYDPETGALTWRVKPNSRAHHAKAGQQAGYVNSSGYLVVGIGLAYFLQHRIIWKLQTGAAPDDQIDHIDGNRTNNSWSNLRPATNSTNRMNAKVGKSNKSGVTGVNWNVQHQSWEAYISEGQKRRLLGRFKNYTDAVTIRRSAERAVYAEFARPA